MQKFTKQIQAQFEKMCATGKLFRSSVSGQKVWEVYLESFSPENNPIFRDPNSTTHNCNLCNNFIRRYGNIVALDSDFNIMSIWDIVDAEAEYKNSANAVSALLKEAPIQDVFFETFNELNSLPYESCSKKNDVFKLGIDRNTKRYTQEEAELYGVVKPNETRTFYHLYMYLPSRFVDMSGKSVDAIMGEYRDAKNVFKRAMDTISVDTFNLVKDLIVQGSLLDGQTHLHKIERILPFKQRYDSLKTNLDNWCWATSYNFPYAKFRNELIGVLCSELAEGKEINEACRAWNKRVDPANYMKAVAPITKRQIEEAKKFVMDNGYEQSFLRRFATTQDIKVSEILHANTGDGKLKDVTIFDQVKSTSTRHKRAEFSNVEEVPIEKFMKDILPGCTSVEAFLENSHQPNMVSLTTSKDEENSKQIFKWDNNYSWTFSGNLAGKSMIKEAVKSAGGKVDGVLRFSISWNEDGRSIVDFDAHAHESDGTHIYFGAYKGRLTPQGGMLDVDMINPAKLGVENITWQDIRKMRNGIYAFAVHNYNGRVNHGFKAEIEFDGQVFSYSVDKNVQGTVPVATVELIDGTFRIVHLLPESDNSKELYSLDTNQFHKVKLVCLSPNHWGNNNVGNLHYFFMLENCKVPEAIRSFHNENLIPELAQHRKVLEVLGNTTKIEPEGEQLTGLGFNATVRESLLVRIQGTHKRVIKLKF